MCLGLTNLYQCTRCRSPTLRKSGSCASSIATECLQIHFYCLNVSMPTNAPGGPPRMNTAEFVVAKRPSLAALDRFPKVDFADYERRLGDLQKTLQRVQQAYLATPHRAVIVLEGWDTAGKGGVVRRLGWALDPRSFKVHAIAAPTSREKSLHYLQRFLERLPEHRQIVVFDRSWYGRELVASIVGSATPVAWRRTS